MKCRTVRYKVGDKKKSGAKKNGWHTLEYRITSVKKLPRTFYKACIRA